jgi:transposase
MSDIEAATPPDLQQIQARLLEVDSACSRAKRLVRKAYEQVADVSEELANGDLLSALQELEEANLGGQVYMDLVAMLKNGEALQALRAELAAERQRVADLTAEVERLTDELALCDAFMIASNKGEYEENKRKMAAFRDRLASLAPLTDAAAEWLEWQKVTSQVRQHMPALLAGIAELRGLVGETEKKSDEVFPVDPAPND